MELTFQPEGLTVEISPEETIAEAAQRASMPMVTTCAGKGRCQSCRIVLLEGQLSTPTAKERATLGDAALSQNFRLACQAHLLAKSAVQISPPRAESAVQILSAAEPHQTVGLAPEVRKIYVNLPIVTEEHLLSDFEEIRKYVPFITSIDLAALQTLPTILMQADRKVTLTTFDTQMIAVEPGDTTRTLYGVAVDIGSTTVVGYLFDLTSEKKLAVSAALNGQTQYGGDVMARITLAQQQANGLRQLHDAVVGTLNQILADLCTQAGISPQHIYEMAIVGNTCMHHLFLQISPVQLGLAPYQAAIRHRMVVTAEMVGLKILPQARVMFLPLIAGFVGADTVGVILATHLLKATTPTLAVDIGTNGEIVLAAKGRLLACSTAAGTAFEGGHITYGMRGAKGAIDRVVIQADVQYHVIGDGPARGICGSGLVDAVAQMLDAGILTPTGRLLKPREVEQQTTLNPQLKARLTGEGQQRSFILAHAHDTETGEPIVLTQQDIRELQLAKAAVLAGIKTLMHTLAVRDEEITELLMAGAFGNYIDKRSAVRIGLIPPLSLEKIRSVGNAAGLGAQMALLSVSSRETTETIATHTTHVPLTHNLDFQRIFAESMGFPEPDTTP